MAKALKEEKAAVSAAGLSEELRLRMFRSLIELRETEQKAHDMFLQNLVKGTVHLSLGMEGVAAGCGAAMEPGDLTFCTYRGHAHEWKVWKDVKLPEGKILVPGVVSHGTNVVEHPELVAERLLNFARCVGRENVIAGTDCGFAQEELNRRVHPSIMWAKLESMAEGARIASGELWGKKAQA